MRGLLGVVPRKFWFKRWYVVKQKRGIYQRHAGSITYWRIYPNTKRNEW